MKALITCILALSLLFVNSIAAEEIRATDLAQQNSERESEKESEKETDSAEPDSQDGEPKAEATSTKIPVSENLKNRDLGAAFRTFSPSEEISADNAVPYPVDI
jgi:hypothetical protein